MADPSPSAWSLWGAVRGCEACLVIIGGSLGGKEGREPYCCASFPHEHLLVRLQVLKKCDEHGVSDHPFQLNSTLTTQLEARSLSDPCLAAL